MALGTHTQIQADISSGTYYLGFGSTLTGLLTGQVSSSHDNIYPAQWLCRASLHLHAKIHVLAGASVFPLSQTLVR